MKHKTELEILDDFVPELLSPRIPKRPKCRNRYLTEAERVAARRESRKRWNAKNPGKQSELIARWRRCNPDAKAKQLFYQRRWHARKKHAAIVVAYEQAWLSLAGTP